MTNSTQNETFIAWIGQHGVLLRKIAHIYAPAGGFDALHQDLLIAVWKAVPLFRREAKASTFIYRVALNRALNWNRSDRGYRRRHEQLDERAAIPALPDNAPEQEARVARLYAALARLPEAERALALLYLDDLAYAEIAEVLGITESNVGARLTRLRKRLAEELIKGESK